jgi:L-fuconolactonase
MIVDAHQHFWHYNPREYDWIDERMHALKRDFMPDDLLPHMEQAGVDATIAVQTRQTTEETDWLLRLAGAHPFIAGVVGWIDLRADDVEASVAQLRDQPRLAGIRHIVQSEPDDRFLLDPAFGRGIAALGRAGLPYDVLIYPRHLPVAAEFVSRFPAQTFVLDHLAKPEIRTGAIDDWTRDLRRLAGAPNVWCKLSGLVTEADWQAWTPEQIHPYLDVAFDCFGAERLIAGSDWPVCTVAADYSRTMAVVRDYLGAFTSREREAVLGGNARSVYLRDHRPGLGARGSGLGTP